MSIEKPIKPEWFEKDERISRLAMSAMPLEHKTASDLLALWGQEEVEPRALGFGATRYELKLPGGYTGFQIAFVAHKDSVVGLNMSQQSRTAPGLLDRLIDVWMDAIERDDFERDDGILRYEYRSREGLDGLKDAVSRELGPCKVEVPVQHRRAYVVLMDAVEAYDYGTACYFAGVPPAGREAIQSLLADPASHDVIRAVLRSAHPEGRVYAVEAMLKLERGGASISDADRRAMQKIIELEIPISVCEGCFVFQKTAREIFAQVSDP
jgi:hypothetical protein